MAKGLCSILFLRRGAPCAGTLSIAKVTISAFVLELTRHNGNNVGTCSGIHARNPDISLLRNLWCSGAPWRLARILAERKQNGQQKCCAKCWARQPARSQYVVSCASAAGGN